MEAYTGAQALAAPLRLTSCVPGIGVTSQCMACSRPTDCHQTVIGWLLTAAANKLSQQHFLAVRYALSLDEPDPRSRCYEIGRRVADAPRSRLELWPPLRISIKGRSRLILLPDWSNARYSYRTLIKRRPASTLLDALFQPKYQTQGLRTPGGCKVLYPLTGTPGGSPRAKPAVVSARSSDHNFPAALLPAIPAIQAPAAEAYGAVCPNDPPRKYAPTQIQHQSSAHLALYESSSQSFAINFLQKLHRPDSGQFGGPRFPRLGYEQQGAISRSPLAEIVKASP
ncbi:hypothetical protein JHW43_000468 [Diplocarpon mali]|nr:hypothetical protein JHW43_000468 [Diplocarpon mali]